MQLIPYIVFAGLLTEMFDCRGRQQSMGGDVQMQAPADRPAFQV